MGQMDGGPLQDRGEISCSALCRTVENYEEGLIHYRQPCVFFPPPYFVNIYERLGNVLDVVQKLHFKLQKNTWENVINDCLIR